MSSQMHDPIDACACPLCGLPNKCAMEVAKQKGCTIASCWCVNVSFSQELLAQVPTTSQRKACICQACATKDRYG